MSYLSGNDLCDIARWHPLLLSASGMLHLISCGSKREALYHTLLQKLGTVCIPRCFGVTSWQPCSGIRGHGHVHQKMRGQHTATAAAVDQQTATAEVPKSNKQQQKKQSGQKNGKNSGGKDKKSELAVTPKSEDFAR